MFIQYKALFASFFVADRSQNLHVLLQFQKYPARPRSSDEIQSHRIGNVREGDVLFPVPRAHAAAPSSPTHHVSERLPVVRVDDFIFDVSLEERVECAESAPAHPVNGFYPLTGQRQRRVHGDYHISQGLVAGATAQYPYFWPVPRRVCRRSKSIRICRIFPPS